MKFGEGWSLGQAPRAGDGSPLSALLRRSMGLYVSLLVGCASGPPHFDQTLMADRGAISRNQGVVQAYHVFCPDVLQLTLAGRPDLSGRRAIDSDGRIDLGNLGKPRIEGRSLPQVINLLSEETGLSADQIHVRVAEFNSQQIYLYGQVIGSQRSVPYQGPETVLDLLQRVGGITPGAASNDVHVVRSRLADNQLPLVFHIDLRAIVMIQDQRTNLRLQPFDQVFVGEAKKSSLEKCLPPCLRPVYEKLCGMRRPGSFSYGDPLPVQSLKANLAARSSPMRPTTARGASDPE